MEPAEAEDSLSEGLLLINEGEGGAEVAIEARHIGLDAARRLHGHLH